MSKVKTQYFPELIDNKTADASFEFIEQNTLWVDGIYSKRASQLSRKAYYFFCIFRGIQIVLIGVYTHRRVT